MIIISMIIVDISSNAFVIHSYLLAANGHLVASNGQEYEQPGMNNNMAKLYNIYNIKYKSTQIPT